jgi:hypothetical protein
MCRRSMCVRRYLIESLGYRGLRFDFSKGYGGSFAGQYTRAALGDQGGFAVGEYWVRSAHYTAASIPRSE